MKTSELIAKLQELDPSGEMEIVTWEYEGQTQQSFDIGASACTVWVRDRMPELIMDRQYRDEDMPKNVIFIG